MQVLTLVFIAGGFVWQVRQFSSRFDRLDEKDETHDARLSNHEKRIIAVEKDVEHHAGWMREMRDQLREIYNHIVLGSNK